MKIKRDLGHLEGHWLVEIYELEDGRCICVNRDTGKAGGNSIGGIRHGRAFNKANCI